MKWDYSFWGFWNSELRVSESLLRRKIFHQIKCEIYEYIFFMLSFLCLKFNSKIQQLLFASWMNQSNLSIGMTLERWLYKQFPERAKRGKLKKKKKSNKNSYKGKFLSVCHTNWPIWCHSSSNILIYKYSDLAILNFLKKVGSGHYSYFTCFTL